jgi:hypothetical protein
MSDPLGGAADTAIEHGAADAVTGVGGAPKAETQDTHCLNCGKTLVGDFCHACGQGAQSLRRPFWALVGESIETLFAIDGRVARTLPNLLLHPGRMTRLYLDGQRARFIPPFRLYVLASLVFFVLLPLVIGQRVGFVSQVEPSFGEARAQIEESYQQGDMTEVEYQQAIGGMDKAEALWMGSLPSRFATPHVTDGGESAPAPPDADWAGLMPKEALDAIREAGEKGDEDAARFAEVMDRPGQLAEQTRRWIPRMMFVLLPVFACLLALVYLWRRQFLFFDHLIVSLHFHAALFFAMSLGVIVAQLVGWGWVTLALIVYSNVYLYRLNRVAYGRGPFSSVLTTATLDSLYFCVLLTALLMAIILGALSL